jgi:hypothetical protein
MDIQSSVLNELFVLYPLIIQGWVSPVKPADIAHGGIPKALYDGNPQGLECLVDPWTELQMRSSTMAVDDRVDLYCNGNLVPGAGQTVKPGEETLRQRLYLPHGILMHGVNRLHYVVTRVGGDFEPSRDLLVLYHLRPADNLDLVIPADVLKDGVSAERARLGVKFEFPYANRRDYDRIEFLLGDTQVRFDVPDDTAPITHTLFTDTFQKAGDNPSAVAEFYVVDQLGNRVKSPEKRLDIHLAAVVPVPTLTNVRDANDKEIPNAGITTSTTVKLTGTASKGKEVEIYDGSGPSAVPKGKATADATTGVWELTITVPAGARRLYAKSLYHSGNIYSNVRTLTVIAAIVPTITNVKDASDKEIPNAGITTSTTVKLKGTASNGQQVEIFDGTGPSAVSIGKATAHATTGIWELTATVAAGAHRFAAQSLYHSNPVYSNVRTLTVIPAIVPTITNVQDASDKEIPNAGITTSTTVKLKGTASNGQQVEIFDGTGPSAVSIGKATAHATTGIWELTATVAAGAHRLYAKSLYHSGDVFSNVRTLTVVVAVAPTIDSVKGSPSGVEIPPGGPTVETSVTLTGKASKGQKVQVLDGSTPKGEPTADLITGIWTLLVTGLSVALHSFTAKALYGAGQVSAPWALTVAKELVIENPSAPLVLNGRNYSIADSGLNWIRKEEFPNTTGKKNVSGGAPPYSFASSAPRIASVDNNGLVRSEGNGTAIITVTDAALQQKTFQVQASNVFRIITSPTALNAAASHTWIQAQTGSLMTIGKLIEITTFINRAYRPGGVGEQVFFPGTPYTIIGPHDAVNTTWFWGRTTHFENPEGVMTSNWLAIAFPPLGRAG